MKYLSFFIFVFLCILSFGQSPKSLQVAKSISPSSQSIIIESRLDQDGNTYLVGAFSGTFSWDTQFDILQSDDKRDIFLIKLNNENQVIWQTQLGTNEDCFVGGMDISNSGQVFINYTESVTKRDSFGISRSSLQWHFCKYDSDGKLAWISTTKSSSNSGGFGVTATEDGGAIYTGYYASTLTIQPNFGISQIPKAPTKSQDGLVMKVDQNGIVKWYQVLESSDVCIPYRITQTDNGNLYITGHYSGEISGNTSIRPSSGGVDIFISKFDSLGNHIRSNVIGTSGNDQPFDLEIFDDTLYIAGYITGNTTLGNSKLNGSIENGFISRLDSNLNFIDGKRHQSQATSRTIDLTVTKGDIYTTGYIISRFTSARIDSFYMPISKNQRTLNVVKYDRNLNCLWAQTLLGYDSYGTTVKAQKNIITVTGMAMDGEFKFDPIYESSEAINTLYENNTSVLLEIEDCHLNSRLAVNGSTITSLEKDATYEWVTFNNGFEPTGFTTKSIDVTKPGFYAVKVTKDECSVISEFANLSTLGIRSESLDVKIYPNPSSDIITLDIPSQESFSFFIYDSKGTIARSASSLDNKLDISALNAGTYHLIVQTKNKLYNGKFVKL